MSNTSILFSIENNVGKIVLNRPDTLNSFNRIMAKELQRVLDECAASKSVRAIYLTGAGRAFCAGQDLQEAIAPNIKISDIVREVYNPIIEKIRNIEKPVLCGVNGVAAGAGANIAFACDITCAAESATFIQSFANIGLIPDSAGTYFLPRLVGLQRATAMAMLADKIKAAQARDLGLIWNVFPDDTLQAETFALAQKLANMPTKGLGLTKRLFNAGLSNTLQTQLELEEKIQEEAATSYDYNEGVKAFLEKRKPVFKGE